jgi:hypothetical protein
LATVLDFGLRVLSPDRKGGHAVDHGACPDQIPLRIKGAYFAILGNGLPAKYDAFCKKYGIVTGYAVFRKVLERGRNEMPL